MSNHHLATYLNDHLAGSVVALQLLDYLKRLEAAARLKGFLTKLHDDIMADREELETMMRRWEIHQSAARQAVAWLGEKATQLKLRLDDPAAGSLLLLEALEGLSLGIEGKRALWRALAAAAEGNPRLRGPDYALLEQRAGEQRARVESQRLEAARAAFTG